MVKQLHHFLLITLRQCNELVQKVWSKNVTKYGLTIKNMILKCRLRVTKIDQTNCSLFIYEPNFRQRQLEKQNLLFCVGIRRPHIIVR